MAITTQMRADISRLYVALFNRAPDTQGMAYWGGLLAQGTNLREIADTMFLTVPARAFYPAGVSPAQIATSFYVNVLGRQPDAEGLAYWSGRLSEPGASPGSLIVDLLAVVAGYAGSDTAGISSAAFFNNRAAVALYYADKSGALANAASVLVGVRGSSDLAAVFAAIDASVAPSPAPAPSPAAPVQTTLTAGADALTGDGADNQFEAGAGSLNAGDSIDGAGGFDVLRLGASGQSLAGVTLTSLEEIRLVDGGTLNAPATALGTIAFGHAAATDTGSVTLAIDLGGANSFDLSGVTAGQAGAAGSSIRATYANAGAGPLTATLSGLDDTFTGSANADVINGGAGNDTIDGSAGADTINGGDGDDRISIAIADGDSAHGGAGRDTLVITGSSPLTIDATATTGTVTGFEIFDASGMTGADLDFRFQATSRETTSFTVIGSAQRDYITTAAGDDVITMGKAGSTIEYDTIEAGAGKDTLIMVGNLVTGLVSQNVFDLSSPFNQLSTVNGASEGRTQAELENVDLSGIVVSAGVGFTITAFAGGSTIAGTSDTDDIRGGAGDDVIVGYRGLDTIDGGGGANTLALINGGTAALFGATNVDASIVLITHDTRLVNFQTITIAGSTSMTLQLTGQTEAFTISAATATAGATITSGSGNDTITGSALADVLAGGTGTDTLTGGAGADTFNLGLNGSVAGTALDVITDFAAGSDRLSFGGTLATLQVADATALVAGVNVQQSAGGLVTFAAADNTLALKIAAIQADPELDSPRSIAFFVDGGDTYVYSAGIDPLNLDDQIVQLTGITTLTTITAGITSTIA